MSETVADICEALRQQAKIHPKGAIAIKLPGMGNYALRLAHYDGSIIGDSLDAGAFRELPGLKSVLRVTVGGEPMQMLRLMEWLLRNGEDTFVHAQSEIDPKIDESPDPFGKLAGALERVATKRNRNIASR